MAPITNSLLITRLQKAAAQGIVNVFETGTPRGDYANVTLMAGDTGHLTYGRSQTTLGSGNLTLLLRDYCDAPGAKYADALRKYIPRCAARDLSLDWDADFKALLKNAGGEPVMQTVQDAFFDRVYWQPAARIAAANGVVTPLGVAVVYDSTVHGSFNLVAARTNRKVGVASVAGEKAWIRAYVIVRREWLANHSNALLHKTTYRMDAFRKLLDGENWNLDLPMTVRDCALSVASLGLAWELCLSTKTLGDCTEVEGSNYFPARTLLNAVFGVEDTTKHLAPGTPQSSALTTPHAERDGRTGGPKGTLLWEGKKIDCATIASPTATLIKVRDAAMWLGLDVVPDAASMTVNLTRAAQAMKAK